MNKKQILVIGDSCRDIFVYCDTRRLCPDIPVPILNIVNKSENSGMAKNVQINIKNLLGSCDIITNENWYNITKTRYVHDSSNHTFFRVDSDYKIKRINIRDIHFNYKLIVISDYNKGFLKEDDIEYICSKHNNVFVDTKKILGNWVKNAKYIKINNYEYINSKNYIDEFIFKKVIHTDGANGATFKGKIYPTTKVEVKDSSGAGDAFMAALCVKYLKTNNIQSAIKFANKNATEVVKHKGVTTISNESVKF